MSVKSRTKQGYTQIHSGMITQEYQWQLRAGHNEDWLHMTAREMTR